MLEFKQSDTAATILVTLTEFVTIPTPNYLFVFTNRTTKQVVNTIINYTLDTSLFKNRYNQFVINPSVLFSGYPPGQWRFAVYQQVSAVNTDTTLTQGRLEYGEMILDRATAFSYNNYDTPTLINAYNG